MRWKDSQCSEDYVEFETQSRLTMHENLQQNNARPFTCQLCKSTFNRASQLDYHHRNTHLKEKSQICQFCGKGFFRKADLRTHLNIHLGTNYCICEICGRKFNHMSNLIRHCRMHSGVKPYPCLICGKRFTQISSLVRHKRIHERTSDHFCNIHYNAALKSKISKTKSNELLQKQKIFKRQHYCQVCGESFCFVFLLKEHQKSHSESTKSVRSPNSTEGSAPDNDVRKTSHDIQDSTTLDCDQKNDKQMCIITDNGGEEAQIIQSVIYISSEQVEEVNPEMYVSSHQFLDHHTKVNGSIKAIEMESDHNIDINISEVLNSYNCEQIGILHNEISTSYPTNLEKDNLGSLVHTTVSTVMEEQSLNTRLAEYPLSNEGFVSRQGAIEESCEENKNQSFSFGGSEFCTEASEHKSKMKDAKDSLYNDKHSETVNNTNNTLLNYTEPTLRLIQTETGEQFYELVMNTFSEQCPDNYRKPNSNTKEIAKLLETDNNVDKIEYSLDNFINISHDLNNALYDLQDDAKKSNTTVPESEQLFYVSLKNKDYSVDISEKDIESIHTLNLNQLGNDPETDFENYVESSFEVLERGSYENNAERFLELIEIAEGSLKPDVNGSYRQSPVSLTESGNEQFFELLEDSQGGQEIIYKTDSDISIVNTSKSGVLCCAVDNAKPYMSNSTDGDEKVKKENSNAFVKNILTNSYDCELENHVQNTKKTKGFLKKFQCAVCQKVFSTAYSYKQHMGTHFTDQQKFHCKECGMSFAWKSTLNKHMANNHRSDGPQKFACETCTKVYRTLSQVNEHVKRDHLKQRDHVCLYCGKSFFKKFDLKTHSRTHTDERPYVCRACGKTFHHQSHIIRHERIHSGERPYVCDVCHKSFTQPGSLKVHKQKHGQTKTDLLDCQLDEDDPLILGKL